jgi:hypothetical protein
MATKSTQAEKAKRVNEIYKLLIIGTSRSVILRYGSEKWGEISDRQIEKYIADARQLMLSELHGDRKQAFAEEIAMRKHLYQKAYQAKKYQTCLGILDSIAKLQGLFELSIPKNVSEIDALRILATAKILPESILLAAERGYDLMIEEIKSVYGEALER